MLNFRIGKYADVRVDFAFKRCFGCEEHKAVGADLMTISKAIGMPVEEMERL